MAFRRTDDPQLGDFDDAAILSRYGETPDDLATSHHAAGLVLFAHVR